MMKLLMGTNTADDERLIDLLVLMRMVTNTGMGCTDDEERMILVLVRMMMIVLMVTNTDDDERMIGCYNTQVKDEEKRMVMILKQRRMTV